MCGGQRGPGCADVPSDSSGKVISWLQHIYKESGCIAAAQIHVQDDGKKVHIYSRNSEDMTPRYPDIVSRLPGWLAPGTKSVVIDGEAVAWDQEKNKILPFQASALQGSAQVHFLSFQL